MELKQLQVPVIVVCVLAALIATFAIVCRVWARALTRKSWEANDWLMVVAYIGLLGELVDAIVFVFVQYYGVHIKDVPTATIMQMKRHPESRYILTSMALTASVFCNLSITQLYTTFFPYTRFRIVCRVLLALTMAYYISFMTVQFFSCPQNMKNALAMAKKCADNSKTIWVGASAGAICIDLANVILPMPLLWRLNVEFEKKVRLTLLFGLGFFILSISAVRMYLYRHMDPNDWTYHTGRIILFNGPEPALGILAGCLPVMSPCLRIISDKLKSFRSCRVIDEDSLEMRQSEHPPTIGHAKRMSLRAMGLGSAASEGFDRLESQPNIVPQESGTITAAEEGKEHSIPISRH